MKPRAMWLGFAVCAAFGQKPPDAVFQSTTKLVEVDVVVRGRKGPVAGLTKEDFALLDNGKPQEIAVFSVRSAMESLQPSKPASPLPPGVVSNREDPDGGKTSPTSTILLIDRITTSWANQVYANQRIVKFIETRRGRDWLGVYALGNDVRALQDLTGDPELLRRAVKNLQPGSAAFGTELEAVIAIQRGFEGIARHLAKVPGRKNLIWITSGFPIFSKIWGDFTPYMREAARALNDANVALYAVDARGLVVGRGAFGGLNMPGIETMNLLAGLTGGQVRYADNGIDDEVREAIEDGELTYTLGFYPPEDARDGQWHKLQVKVAQPGLSARYRENYFAPTAQAAANERPGLEQLLDDSLDASQIGLTAQAPPDPLRPGFFDVSVFVDTHDVQLAREGTRWVGSVDVSFHLEGSSTIRKFTRKIDIAADQLAASLEKAIVVETSFQAQSSGAVLRVVAQDTATGAAGSLRIPLGGK